MIKVIVCVRDTVSELYRDPACVPTIGAALREMSAAAKHPENALKGFEKDFDVYQLGTFDDSTGEVKPDLKKLCNLAELLDVGNR